MVEPSPKDPPPPETPPGADPLRGSAGAWLAVGLPLFGGLATGVAFGQVRAGFAVLLGALVFAVFLLWLRRSRTGIRRQYARLRGDNLQKALRSQRLALSLSVVDGLPDPLFILNKRREVTLANRAARELFGRSVVGRDLALTLRQPQVLSVVDRSLRTASPGETEISLLAPVNRDFHALVAPLFAAAEAGFEALSEEQPAIAFSLHEITEIRRIESMRADFVANASHELKTPLANLVGFIETLKGPARDDEAARLRFLDIMQAEAARMSRLISDLLSLSRIELDEHMRPEAEVDIVNLLEAVTHMMEMRAGARRIRFVIEAPEDAPHVQGDQDQLVQVFQNLIDNAIKYGREGSAIRLVVTPVPRLPQGQAPGLLVAVADEGEGIPAEHIPRLTERFYRVDAGRSRKLGGTGLGLAIVKHIVRRHRGWLDIKSESGKGTTVTVGLPLYRPDAPGGR